MLVVVGIASPEAKAAADGATAAVGAPVAAFVAACVVASAAEDAVRTHDAGMSAVVAEVPLEEADTAATLGTVRVR
jgi:hypothetical protein